MMMKTFIAVWHRRNAARVAFECVQAANHAVNQSVEKERGGREWKRVKGEQGERVIKAVLEDNAALGIDKIVKTKKVCCPICGRVRVH